MKYLNFANSVSGNNRPEIVMSLIDFSPSMDYSDYKPTRKDGAIKANYELLKIKHRNYPSDKMGIIGFGGTAKLLQPAVSVSQGIKNIENALNKPFYSSGTNFTAALTLAGDHLFNKSTKLNKPSFLRTLSQMFFEFEDSKFYEANDGILRRVIMLTDGEYNRGGRPLQIASELKDAGVIIDCIGIGGSPKDVDEVILKQIASKNPDGSIRYCFIGDQQQLIRKYQSLAKNIRVI